MTGVRRAEPHNADAAEGLAARMASEPARTLTHAEVWEAEQLIASLRADIARHYPRNGKERPRAALARSNLDRLQAILAPPKGDQGS